MRLLTALWEFLFGKRPAEPEIKYIPLTPPIQPITPPKPPPMPPKKDMLTVICTAFRDFEGKPGDLNYQLNNPGDFRPSPVGYLAVYEPVEIIDTDTDPRYPYHIGKFAKFKDYATGWLYLQNSIHHWAQLHPEWTIKDLVYHYAPPSDKNPTDVYAANIAKACGVPLSTTLQELFS